MCRERQAGSQAEAGRAREGRTNQPHAAVVLVPGLEMHHFLVFPAEDLHLRHDLRMPARSQSAAPPATGHTMYCTPVAVGDAKAGPAVTDPPGLGALPPSLLPAARVALACNRRCAGVARAPDPAGADVAVHTITGHPRPWRNSAQLPELWPALVHPSPRWLCSSSSVLPGAWWRHRRPGAGGVGGGVGAGGVGGGVGAGVGVGSGKADRSDRL